MRRIAPVVVFAAMAVAGCQLPQEPLAAAPPPAQAEADYLAKTALEGGDEKGADNAVDSALAWSEKYAQAVERLLTAQQQNRQLHEQNRQATAEVAKLQAELAQSRKELTDANAMLIEMRGALENWKRDVLGFRGEIRAAQGAQLEALSKVLKLLGGEVPEPTTRPAEKQAPQPQEEAKEVARDTSK